MTDPAQSEARPKLTNFGLEELRNGDTRAIVELTWADGDLTRGTRTGHSGEPGTMRSAAQACLDALAPKLDTIAFELLGVKAVRAFDATVVVVSLSVVGGVSGPRLVGSALVEESAVSRGAVIAVLQATNRLTASPSRR